LVDHVDDQQRRAPWGDSHCRVAVAVLGRRVAGDDLLSEASQGVSCHRAGCCGGCADASAGIAMPTKPARRLRSPRAQNTSPSAPTTASAPSVTDSKNTRDTPQLDSIEYDWPSQLLIAPGQTSVITVTSTNASVMSTASQAPSAPPGTRYGRGAD